jgi:hypothetical protein
MSGPAARSRAAAGPAGAVLPVRHPDRRAGHRGRIRLVPAGCAAPTRRAGGQASIRRSRAASTAGVPGTPAGAAPGPARQVPGGILEVADPSRCLLVIPCSAQKATGGQPPGPAAGQDWPPGLAPAEKYGTTFHAAENTPVTAPTAATVNVGSASFHASRRDRPSTDATQVRKISFRPTSRRSSHVSPNQSCPPGTVRVTEPTVSANHLPRWREFSAPTGPVRGGRGSPSSRSGPQPSSRFCGPSTATAALGPSPHWPRTPRERQVPAVVNGIEVW